MKLSDFNYELTPDRIAQEPVSPRDHSRLLVLDRKSGTMRHQRFFEIGTFLTPGDVLVRNSTKVFPARLRGRKKTGGKAEALLLKPMQDSTIWRALVRGTTRRTELVFPDGLSAQMEERLDNGEWVLRFSRNSLRSYLDRYGEMPLPPYIKRPQVQPQDLQRYQTVYAGTEGAVAAPTAGFHFTPNLISKLQEQGVVFLDIILHVGWGTFRPIRVQDIEKHPMLSESYFVSSETAEQLNQAKTDHRRIIAIGTTSVRTLETICDKKGTFSAGEGETDLFIYPGYRYKAVDGLVTNFHLPDSTPLLLANAFFSDKRNQTPFALRPAYEEAIREGYRFYSYGDAMLIQ